ncbi:hypothetical protein GCM10011331_04120 [Flavimobilis marinus]|uniref:Uncharacterized protein n=2 Tax=Flavimobilis marinus TaxID=285351 RepID=A0A1I2DJL5_9MICO|nr:hypothetical protein GCM10011331_04120 [Flavimobilis marinus]SFE80657.1 hypothetical protein SAMN04488035_0589 [Flavimobilis marinus]
MAWSLDPNQRLADPAWRRRHGWSVLIAVGTLGIGTAAWFALISLRPGVSGRYKFWAWFWGVFTGMTYSLLGPAFFVPVADDATAVGTIVVVWMLRLLSVVQAVVMNRVLLRERAVAEVQREAALLSVGLGRGGPGAFGSAPAPGSPFGAPAAARPSWPSAAPGTLGPPVASGGRVLDPGPLAPPVTPGPARPSWQPAPADGTGEGRRLDL